MKILNNARTVSSADGTHLEAYSWGNPQHPALVLIHGGMQSGLSFSTLVESALAQEYFLVTFDLRGHFRSEKPSAADAYSLRKWADDLQSVITTYELQKPVVLGWSLGGCVI